MLDGLLHQLSMILFTFSSHSYMNDWEKLKETQLPPIEAFYNSLRKEALSPEQYAHGQRVWNELGFSTMEEFCGTYLALDVLLLGIPFPNCESNN